MTVLKRICEYVRSWLPLRRTYTFAERFRHAQDLLDFAIAEGSEIDEWVIDQIDGADLETVDHALLDKAYRVLVEKISPVTWSSLRFSNMSKATLLGISLIVSLSICIMRDTMSAFALVGTTGGIFLLVWFLDIFTGIVTKKRMIEIVIFCYLFTFAAVIGPLVLFFGAFSWYPNLEGVMKANPVGLLRGCSEQSEPGWVPKEVQCGASEKTTLSQWVLNIGGIVPGADKGPTQPTAGENEKTASLGGQEQGAGAIALIQGGVVVPLYVIVLALMGGAVSMTRRVPEYQRRVYLSAADEEHISRERGRELLVFQIMQVLSAPLIAIAAYYTIKPTEVTVSVLLGFISGFASETILLAIRALVEKLNPGTGKTQQKPRNAQPPPADSSSFDGGSKSESSSP